MITSIITIIEKALIWRSIGWGNVYIITRMIYILQYYPDEGMIRRNLLLMEIVCWV